MKEKTAVKALRDIKKVLDKLSIKYWPDSGTLLGMARDGKMIEWDTDIDFGMWYDDREQVRSNLEEFKSFGFDVIVSHDYVIRFVRENIFIAIYLYHKRGDNAFLIWLVPEGLLRRGIKRLLIFISLKGRIWRLLSQYPIVVPKHYFEKLSTIKSYGMDFNIPSNVERYLEYRYGIDWKVPKKNWVYYKDDGAINLNWKFKK